MSVPSLSIPQSTNALPIPGPQQQRIVSLDAVRGFALLGILLMNIQGFSGPLLLSAAGTDPQQVGINWWIDTLVYIVVQGSFYPLFALLFGIGFALMEQRLAERGQKVTAIHLRRMGILMLIGVLHGLLIWSGDILFTYGLLGLLLPVFCLIPKRWLWWIGGLGIAYAVGSVWLMAALIAAMGMSPDAAVAIQEMVEPIQKMVADQQLVYAQGSYLQAVGQRLGDLLMLVMSLFTIGPLVFGLFVCGAALVKNGLLANPEQYARFWALLRWVAWPLGLLLSLLAWSISSWNTPWDMSFASLFAQGLKMLAGCLIGLGWLAWGLRLYRAFGFLAAAGRMALTTYLTQSLVCTLVFYGYGLGLFGSFSRVQELGLVLALFAAQVVLAQLWLRCFTQGPVEWLWRAGTYGRFPPLRRQG